MIDARIREPRRQPDKGYDHCWLLDGLVVAHGLRTVTLLSDASKGHCVPVLTSEPVMRFCFGNFLEGRSADSGGQSCRTGGGICLESPHNSDSPRYDSGRLGRPGTVLRLGPACHSGTACLFVVP